MGWRDSCRNCWINCWAPCCTKCDERCENQCGQCFRAFRHCVYLAWLVRFLMIFLICVAMGITYSMRTTMHIASVFMIDNKDEFFDSIVGNETVAHREVDCEPGKDNIDPDLQMIVDGEIEWTSGQVTFAYHSYYYGYLFGALPGGRMSESSSAVGVIFVALLVNSLMCTFTPYVVEQYSLVIGFRMAQGFCGGMMVPAIHALLARWCRPEERAFMVGNCYGLSLLAFVMTQYTGRYFVYYMGWQYVFYINGGIGIIFCPLWLLLTSDYPNEHLMISEHERKLLENIEIDHRKELEVEWKRIFNCKPFLVLMITAFFHNIGYLIGLFWIPNYVTDIVRFLISKDLIYMALPYFGLFAISFVLGFISYALLANEKISVSLARKIPTVFATLFPCIFLIGLNFVGCNKDAAYALYAADLAFMGGAYPGFTTTMIDLSPNFAATLTAVITTMTSIQRIILPVIYQYTIEAYVDIDMDDWRVVLYTAAFCQFLAFALFTIFGTSDKQDFNDAKEIVVVEEPPAEEE